MNATAYTYRRPLFSPFTQAGGDMSRYSGPLLLENGESFEHKAIVGSNVLLAAATKQGFMAGGSMPIIHNGTKMQDIYVARPCTFSLQKENDEIVLQLERATPVTGNLRYDNGEPAVGETIHVAHRVPPARGADIAEVRNFSSIGTASITDDNGNFEFPFWPGEFTLSAGGTPWSEPVTKTIYVEHGKPLEVDLTIPTPLRITVVMPDGSLAGNFRMSRQAVWHYSFSKTGELFPNASFTALYDSRSQFDEISADETRSFVVPNRPITMYLCQEENYVTVMTEDNEYGIVRKLEPELMGKELTLTLRPTISGTVKLNATDQDISILMRIINKERNRYYAVHDGYFAAKLWFHTDADGQGSFKVPVFEEVGDSISLYFKRGAVKWGNGGSVWASRLSWLGRSPVDKLKGFRPPATGEPFDLGTRELER